MGRGRPRAFDRDAALRRAMELFWAHGYEGVSISMLTESLGITSTSLYAAFGGKEALFDEAVELYDPDGDAPVDRAVLLPTVREVVETLLRDNVNDYVDPATPTGCMIVLAAVNVGAGNDRIGEKLAARRRRALDTLRERIVRGCREGDLPRGLDADLAAAYVATVQYGLSSQTRDGCTAEMAHRIVDVAMQGWDRLVQDAAAKTSA